MSSYHNLNIEPELPKIPRRDDEIRNLKNQTEKQDHENFLKPLKVDSDYYKKKYKSLKKENKVNYH